MIHSHFENKALSMTKYTSYLSALSRPAKVAVQLTADCVLVAMSFMGAMLFRLENAAFLEIPANWVAVLSRLS